MKKRALISVSNKAQLIPFCEALIKNDFEIISTGGTKKFLEDNKIPVISISDITHFPEILDGRVKTLHPNIHAALLCNRDIPEHIQSVEGLKIDFIDLLVVNLYPFKETIQKENIAFENAIEQIDIGGPSMLRSAAKNFKHITVLVDVNDYERVIQEIENNKATSLATRQYLSAKVFQHTAAYDAIIANYLAAQVKDEKKLEETLTITYNKKEDLRYGENPHQRAAFYAAPFQFSYSLTSAKQLQGKELSFNNIQDAEAALQIVKEFPVATICVGIKHANPCGVGLGENLLQAWKKMYAADTTSIFGGIVACNKMIDEQIAVLMNEVFLEVIIAPSYSEAALKILQQKKNVRLLVVDMNSDNVEKNKIISINGGLLLQENDLGNLSQCDLKTVTKKTISNEVMQELSFAWKVVKHVKSNAIIITNNFQTLGIGAGQMNRIASAKIALEQAKANTKITLNKEGLMLASDAFFPFNDVVHLANEYGVKAIIQPGGSIKDADSIKVCDDHGIAMLFTGMRHFKH